MSVKYAKVKDLVTNVLTSGVGDSYQIIFTQHIAKTTKASYRNHMRLFLEMDKVWCIQFKKPFADRYIILSGDYSSLSKLKYNSKTNARRNIERRLVAVDGDIEFFEIIAGQVISAASIMDTI